jgi:hypothetical protein
MTTTTDHDTETIRPGKGLRKTEHRMERRTLRQQVWAQIGREGDE